MDALPLSSLLRAGAPDAERPALSLSPSIDGPMPRARGVDQAVTGDALRAALTREAREGAAARRARWRDDLPTAPAPPAEPARRPDALRAVVRRYTRERRASGVSVERLLPEVKGLVREAETAAGWHDVDESLMTRVVRWTIDAYYDDATLQHVPRFY